MGELVHNLLVFTRLLRAAGVATDPERVRLCLSAISRLGLRRRSEFYHAARTTLTYRKQDLEIFDRVFAAFWARPRAGVPASVGPAAPRIDPNARLASRAPLPGGDGGYSPSELLRHKDFGELTEAELERVRAMIAQLNWRLGERVSRRRRAGAGRMLDYRLSWRKNLRYGGEPLERIFRRRVRKPRPLVVIADVSGSMERYSELLMHFLHGLIRARIQPVDAFVFSTRLSRVTRELQVRETARALRRISHSVQDWSGGTRIGQALRAFNFRWARRTLSHGAITAVISDGLDRGQVDLLTTETARLQRLSYRLIWLNPLVGSPGYRPLARGMQAALPHVDHFLPIHNLVSLEQLAARLRELSNRRPQAACPSPVARRVTKACLIRHNGGRQGPGRDTQADRHSAA